MQANRNYVLTENELTCGQSSFKPGEGLFKSLPVEYMTMTNVMTEC